MFDIFCCIAYNIFNKTADTIEQTYPFPAQISVTKNSTSAGQSRGAIFYGYNLEL